MGDFGNKRDALEDALKRFKEFPECSLGWFMAGCDIELAVFDVLDAEYFTIPELKKMGIDDPHFMWDGDEFGFDPPEFDLCQTLLETQNV